MSAGPGDDAVALLDPWPGPYGGLPPYDRATPAALAAAVPQALSARRRVVRAIADDPAPPSFENTAAALEDSARPARQLQALVSACAHTASTGEMPAVAQRLAPLFAALELEIALDRALFDRLDTLWQQRDAQALDAQQRRLVQVLRDRMLNAGVLLDAESQARLKAIDTRLAALSARFAQNLHAEQGTQGLWLDREDQLDGLPEAQRRAAAEAAAARGQAGRWFIANERPAVWPFLTHSTRRELRERVWRGWSGRGGQDGPHDNRPLVGEILQLRGERARRLGHPSHAHAVLARRMARTPEAALAMLTATWQAVQRATQRQVAEMQALADGEGGGFALAPWDRLHYAEKLRRSRFGVDAAEVMQYLPLERMLEALFWSAGRVHGLSFAELKGVPVLHESIRVFAVRREGETLGVLYLDLFQRPGKMHGSHQHRMRAAERFRGRVLPISNVVSGLPPAVPGQPLLMPWEYANVLFHEFGHALHMLMDGARYPSLGSMDVAWDLVELPSLLQEVWLRDRELLRRFARHHATGEPMPEALLARLEAALRHDRIFSVNLDYLGPAIVDLQLHLRADGSGRPIDAVEVERQTLESLGMPACWDLVLGVTHNLHSFAGGYDAGLYAYLWSDVMAADVAELFHAAPGGLYDAGVARRWREQVLSVGHTVPADEAFHALMGRGPDPAALMRRFALA